MQYRFEEIFKDNGDGTLSPTQRIRVGGVIFGPEVKFKEGVAFGGVDFHQFKGHDIRAEQDEDDENIMVITGIY